MSFDEGGVELLLSTLKDNFLAEIPDRCDDIEDYILALEKDDEFADAFKALFRSIHSLKGSGGTMGLPIITSISHQFEDLLSDIDGDKAKVNPNSIDFMLKYNDLLKTTSKSLASQTLEEDSVKKTLESLKAASYVKKGTCLLVEPSKMMLRAVTKALEKQSYHVTTVPSGIVALERLLNESFDVLITSKETPVLNGVALISALRKSETKHAKLPCILTTSKDISSLDIDGMNISAVVKKDKSFADNLSSEIQKLS